jgi:hypothetical protein
MLSNSFETSYPESLKIVMSSGGDQINVSYYLNDIIKFFDEIDT